MRNSKTPMSPDVDWKRTRCENLIATARALKTVLPGSFLPGSFGTDDELREIGLQTLRFADVEEDLSLYCEALLLRPELRGFHRPKLVLLMPFTEKLKLFKELTIAVGVLRSIDTAAMEGAIESAAKTGEHRNNIIHGYLHTKDDGNVVFRNKGEEFAAELDVLRMFNSRVLQLDEALTKAFMNFYGELVERAPAEFPEKSVLSAVSSRLKLLEATALSEASRKRLAIAQHEKAVSEKNLRSARARSREAKKRVKRAEALLPAEYRELARERDALSRRCTAIAKRSKKGVEDPELELETGKLRNVELELQRLRDRYSVETRVAHGDGVVQAEE